MKRIFIGYDPREAEAYGVLKQSLTRHMVLSGPRIPIHGVCLEDLQRSGVYWRPTSGRDGRLWDDISGAPMSTEFAISRFLVPFLAKRTGWALFMDCDMLATHDVNELFNLADPTKAVQVVKHNYQPASVVKMDNQIQTAYPRKLWSAVMLFNCDHPANDRLTLDYVNDLPGRDLHAFSWLEADEIGDLPESWHWIAGHSSRAITPNLIHWTEGGPWFPNFRNVSYANEWRAERSRWLRSV